MLWRAINICLIMSLTMVQICQAANIPVNVSATVLTKSICRFSTNTATLDFGDLDPSNPTNVTTTATLIYRCQGSSDPATFIITDDDGLYKTGINANRMQHATIPGAFIPYSMSYTPTSATVPKNVNQTLTVTGTLIGSNYATALSGIYSDTVTLTIAP